MAGDWIKMREDLHEDQAVIWMSQQLKCRPEHIVGYCHKFWSYLSRQCHDGTVTGVTLLSMGNVINLPGFPELLVEVGWLEHDDADTKWPKTHVPKFERHLSKGSKTRVMDLERKRKERKNEEKDDGDDEIPCPAPKRKVSRSDPDKNRTRERERVREREQSKKDKKEPPLPPRGEKFVPEDLDLPFGSEGFRSLWSAWCANRRENGKPLKPTAAAEQIRKLAEMGESRAIAALRHSIAGSYQGIFEPAPPKGSGKGPVVPTGGSWL